MKEEHFALQGGMVAASPVLMNLIGTPAYGVESIPAASNQNVKSCPKCPKCPTCPRCKTCPDMSQYIRLDEIPCWNCSLP